VQSTGLIATRTGTERRPRQRGACHSRASRWRTSSRDTGYVRRPAVVPPEFRDGAKSLSAERVIFGSIIGMVRLRSVSAFPRFSCVLVVLTLMFFPGCGGNSGGGGGGGGQPPATPSGLTATAGNQQVALTWNAVTTASSYHVKRATTSGGPYSAISSPSTTSYTDTSLTNGTAYYYVVSAVNANGESGNSGEKSATPAIPVTGAQVTIDVLANRHTISPFVYGGAFPESTSAISDSGTTVVRWGGNAASTYNWQLHTYNADNDYFFEDFNFFGLGNGNNGTGTDADSAQFITDVKGVHSNPLMTMVMLPWVAKEAENGSNAHWSFSVTKYGAQCGVDQFNPDAGNGLKPDCATHLTAEPNDAYYPLLDSHSNTCTGGNCVYRSDWAAATASAFGSGTCAIPYSAINSCHFYDMDNEIDIWGGTHFDIHPSQSGYGELRDTYVTEAAALKGWDQEAVRLGPVSCCWYFYWNLNSSNDNKTSHAGIDFLPWWLNEVAWSDAVSGSRTLDMFDIHAYPDADTTGLTQSQLQALAAKIYRDWWDPTFNSAAQYIVNGGFSIEPVDGTPFRIPRMRALVNQIYPGTPLAITEWSAAFAGATSAQREADFSTALGDADAYGILGRERVSLSTRWTAPASANPNYQALKLYTNYDGAHHGFAPISVSDTNTGNPNLFSSYAAIDSTGTTMTVIIINKDPQTAAQVSFNFSSNGFTPSSVTSYTLASTAPNTITVSSASSWSSPVTVAPYTATLLVITGTTATNPSSEWDLNPDTIMVPAGGTVTLNPSITSGTANVTLANAVFDAYEGATPCTGTINIPIGAITATSNGTITVNAGGTPGFCHFTVTGTDSAGVMQSQGGWIVVGNPAATFTKTGDNQLGSPGGQITLGVTLSPGSSGGTNSGASIYFTTDAGSLSAPIVVTDQSGSGIATVTLTLPSSAGVVHVTAEGPYGLGHPVATFTETVQ
jgi:glycosyl hydrolase family 44